MTRKMNLVVILAAVAVVGWLAYCTLAEDERPRDDWPRDERRPSMEHVERMQMGMHRMNMMMEMLERLKHTCFDPTSAGIVAIGGLKDDVRRKPAEIIKDLEDTLGKTKTLGLRNAIRMSLKDIYKAQGEDEKVLQHLRAMLAENDAAIQAHQNDDEDDEDEEDEGEGDDDNDEEDDD